MGMLNFGVSLVKLVMFAFNFIVFSLGVVCLGIGIWLSVGQSSLFSLVKQINYVAGQDLSQTQNTYLQMGSYVLIACGVLAMLVGFCGCWGTIKNSPFFIIIYMGFCCLIVVFLLASGILAAKFQGSIESALQMAASSALNVNFDGLSNSASLLSSAWYNIMQSYQCCGMNGVGDFTTTYNQTANNWNNNYRTYCPSSNSNDTCFSGASVLIPTSCCKFSTSANGQMQIVDQLCPINMNLTTYYMNGCAVAIGTWASTGASILIGVSFGLPNFILLAIFAADYLRRATTNGEA